MSYLTVIRSHDRKVATNYYYYNVNTTKKQTMQEQYSLKLKQKNTNDKPKHKKLNLNINRNSTLRTARVCVSLCTTVVHNTAQNSSDNLLFYTQSSLLRCYVRTTEDGWVRESWLIQIHPEYSC